jgi:hypothetical protein
MRDLERELRALPRPEPSPELDERIERLHASASRGTSERGSAARRRTLAVVRAAALLLVGLLLGRATAPSVRSAATSPESTNTGTRPPIQATKIEPVSEPGGSPRRPRADDEPPLFAATNVRQLLARAAPAQRGSEHAPPLFAPPQTTRSEEELRPTPLHD